MRKINLLIIDDEAEVVNALVAIFRPNKRYRVHGHTSLAEARAEAERNPPHVMICDCLMPEGDGIALIRELRARLPRLKSILLTGQTFAREIASAIEEGLVELYISKPWKQRELEEAVQRLAREAAKEQ